MSACILHLGMQNLFGDLRILDLSTVLAGPTVATFFAELGAEVIKVENPRTNGDVTRSWKLNSEEKDAKVSAYFSAVNYKKKYIWKDLSNFSDRTEIDALIENSDIVITNFKQGDDIKFSLDFADLKLRFPRLIYVKLKGFDSAEERVAYDVVLQAETGFMYMNGTAESGPVKMPVALMDVLAAHQLKEGVLCALIHRLKTNEGSLVECSLEKAGLSSLANQATNYLMEGMVPQRIGSLHPNIAPYGETFSTSDDKMIVLAVGSEKQFGSLCSILGCPELAHNERFNNNQSRVLNRITMHEELQARFKTKDRQFWMTQLHAHFVPAGAIKSMDEVMENPVAKSMMLDEKIDGVNTRRMATVAFTISR